MASEGPQRQLALWAADCAERVLPYFEGESGDPAVRDAIGAARLWAAGVTDTADAAGHAVAARRAAASATTPAARAAARSAAHAAAAAQAEGHARHAANYAVRAASLAAGPERGQAERAWQLSRLPEELWTTAFPEHRPGRRHRVASAT